MRVRYDFVGNLVVYTSVINGEAFQSIHKRDGMTDEQAKGSFHRDHAREIVILQQQKLQNESKSITQPTW
jgi:hypothetical protein